MNSRISQTQIEALAALEPVFNASHNGIVVVDSEGIVRVYNQASIDMLGDRGISPVGRHMSEVQPEAWPEFLEILYSGKAQLRRRLEFCAATIVANRSPIMMDGEVVGVISVFQDISAYEAIISELQGYKKLHTEMEAIFESSQDGLYITDGDAKTLRVNSAYERVTGLKRERLLGRTMQELVREGVFDHSVSMEVLEKGRGVTIMQNIRGGKQVMVTGTPIFGENGNVALVVTNVRDITELNQLRRQIEESRLLNSCFYQSFLEQQQFTHAMSSVVFKSNEMAKVLHKAVKVAAVDTVVLLEGESGVGKTMLARIIHQMSPRQEAPFVKINCGAIPVSLMESELFGYTKGAFTGASPNGKAGLIEMAHTGTVFFDEVGELTPAMQVKLLQVIEEQTFTRIGDTKDTEVDVRIVAASNRDLRVLVTRGRFREDLFYRLNVIPIPIPALGQRKEDIPVLALHFLKKVTRENNLDKHLDPQVLEALASYHYPGNVRELLNIIERMVVMSEGRTVSLADLPGEVNKPAPMTERFVDDGLTIKQAVEQLEVRMIKSALSRHNTLAQASQALGIHTTTLWRKMGKHGLCNKMRLRNVIALKQ